jgi:acetolactate synthase-1/2/3 large subunit
VTKRVFTVANVSEIPCAVRQAFQLAVAGEPGPVAVVVPYNLLIESHRYNSGPLEPLGVPLDETSFERALGLLRNPRARIGIYAGLGCMDHSAALVRLAEVLQAPVATSIAGKGVIPETHPLSVGWGYGAQGTATAENAFRNVDVILAIGVRFSEVSTGFYGLPQRACLIHVDANADNLGRVMRTQVCVHADAGVFLGLLLEQEENLRRPTDNRLVESIRRDKSAERRGHEQIHCGHCADPMAFLLALRRVACEDALTFVDVTLSQYWATEAFTTHQPRSFFNPTNNQAMGWSIPAALGAQKAHPGRQTLTITGDGCMLMSAMEISTAARENLPVKFFILDDQAYHYMQVLQQAAYMRTTATILARLDYQALARGWGVAYQEIANNDELEARIRGSLEYQGPVLTRVITDYRRRPVRWINAVRDRYFRQLTPQQQLRFLARIGTRAIDLRPEND